MVLLHFQRRRLYPPSVSAAVNDYTTIYNRQLLYAHSHRHSIRALPDQVPHRMRDELDGGELLRWTTLDFLHFTDAHA
ncbi:hypothetical protein M3J09_009042 [Ascochyta lentis]